MSSSELISEVNEEISFSESNGDDDLFVIKIGELEVKPQMENILEPVYLPIKKQFIDVAKEYIR